MGVVGHVQGGQSVKWMCLFLVVGGAEARPLTYSEALTAAVDANPALQRARIAEGQSQTDWKRRIEASCLKPCHRQKMTEVTNMT